MFDRTWTVLSTNVAAATVVALDNVRLPDRDPKMQLEAWSGFNPNSDAYIFEGNLSVSDCTEQIAQGGKIDCLMVVPHGGIGKVRVPGDLEERLTIFFTFGGAVTLRLRQIG